MTTNPQSMSSNRQNKVLSNVKKTVFLLGLTPGVLFAQNKLNKPTDVNLFVKATIEETRGTHKQNFGDLPESMVASTEHVFIQNSVTVSGSSYLDWNSDSLQFQTNGIVEGLDPTKMVLIDSGVARQSTMSELFNAIPHKQYLWSDSNANIRKMLILGNITMQLTTTTLYLR